MINLWKKNQAQREGRRKNKEIEEKKLGCDPENDFTVKRERTQIYGRPATEQRRAQSTSSYSQRAHNEKRIALG